MTRDKETAGKYSESEKEGWKLNLSLRTGVRLACVTQEEEEDAGAGDPAFNPRDREPDLLVLSPG